MKDGESAERKNSRKAAFRAGVVILLFFVVALLLVYVSPDDLYLWIKALHVIAVVSWMAGLLYLPRLFIYHSDTPGGSQASDLFEVMEARLFKIIMNPAMMISWVLGLYLAWSVYGFQGGWLHAKLLAVIGLTITHSYLGRAVRAFGRGERPLTSRSWRMINEIPTGLMVLIVILVIVKPF